MILALSLAMMLAGAQPAAETAKPAPAAEAKAEKPHQVCVTRKVGRLFGHDITHVKCEDAKHEPAKPASTPA
jgi:hypothetical protein